MTRLEETSNGGTTWVERFRWILAPSASLPVVHATVPTSTPAPQAPRSTTYLKWSTLPMPRAGALPSDVTASSVGIIAVAGTGTLCCGGETPFDPDAHASVWRYSEGGWVLVPNQTAFALGNMRGVTASSQLIVAFGVRNLDSKTNPGSIAPAPATWTSRDGLIWQLDTQVPAFVEVTPSPFGFFGATATDQGSEIWSSADGASWRRVADASVLGPGAVSGLRYTALGLVAIGNSPADKGAVSWRSTDGKSWQRSPHQDALAGGTLEDLGFNDSVIEAVDMTETDGLPAAWRSGDGLHWERSTDPTLRIGHGDLRLVMGVPTGFLAEGFSADGAGNFVASLWTSSDGLTWTAVPPDEPGPAGDQLAIAGWTATANGSVLSVGYTADGLPASWLATP
jgi:hypothetical protein